MFEALLLSCSTYPATVPGGHSTVISWFRHGQQMQLSHLKVREITRVGLLQCCLDYYNTGEVAYSDTGYSDTV